MPGRVAFRERQRLQVKWVIDVEHDELSRRPEHGVVVGHVTLEDHYVAPGLGVCELVWSRGQGGEALGAYFAVGRRRDQADVVALLGQALTDVQSAHCRPGHLRPQNIRRYHQHSGHRLPRSCLARS